MERTSKQTGRPTIADLESMVAARGFRVSAGSWEDDTHVYAFSVESYGPATYGHPKCTACWQVAGGWLTVG